MKARGWLGMNGTAKERAQYYRTKALEAKETAAKARSAEGREDFLNFANGLLALAEWTEREG